MEDRKYELGHKKISSLLLKYSAPAIIGMMSNALYNLCDAIFVGKAAGELALGALAISFPLQMFLLAVGQIVGIGAASIYSRNLGAGNQETADKSAGTSFTVVIVLGIIASALLLLFLEPVLRIITDSENILPYAVQYMRIILAGGLFFVFLVSTGNLIRAEGKAKVAMIAMLLGTGLNLILDAIFIFGLKMGIQGAAVATVIAHFITCGYMIHYILRGKSLLKVKRIYLIPDLRLLPEMFAIGSSSFARVMAGVVMMIVVYKSIGHYGEDIHIAVFGVVNRMFLFFLMPVFGLTQGVMPIIGFSWGAKNYKRAREALLLAIYIATGICVFGFLVLYIFTGPVIALFAKEDSGIELLEAGIPALQLIVMAMPFIGIQVISTALFQAIGRAGMAFFLSTFRQITLLIPFVLILPLFIGLSGVWSAFPVADMLAAIVTWILTARLMKYMSRESAAIRK